MTRFVKNANGQTYEVKRAYQDKYGETLLLASYGGRYPDDNDDESSITQYIVAIGWDDGSKLWAYGHYYRTFDNNWVKAYKAAFDDFCNQIRF